MKLGVVCEGQTDYVAIVHFLGSVLAKNGVTAEFTPIRPQMDRTRPESGWSVVFGWLKDNPPAFRVSQFFEGGLFAQPLGAPQLDALIFQVDTDILGEASFQAYISNSFNTIPLNPDDSADRAQEMRRLLSLAARLSEITLADRNLHVLAPAVESTETWCVAAFHNRRADHESLRGADLTNAFMGALESSEGRQPNGLYQRIDKDQGRRLKFCNRHSCGASRIYETCPSFKMACDQILLLAAI